MMSRGRWLLFCLVVMVVGGASLGLALPAAAQSKPAAGDPVSGTWRRDATSAPGFDLTYDGKRTVTGTIGTPNGTFPIKAGTYDPKTRALKLQGDAKESDGSTVPFVIEGTIEGETASGTFAFGTRTGDFTFTRQPK